MPAAAQPKPASLPLPGGRAGASVRLQPLLTGTSYGPPAYFERPPGRTATLRALGVGVKKSEYLPIPIVAFLVEHPEAGPILIDTGLHPSVAVDSKQNLGRLGAAFLGRVDMESSDAVPAQLRARDIEPSDVQLVLMTHFHIDHASAMSEFPGATFVFSSREWEAANRPRGDLRGYHRAQFDHAFDYRTLDLEGTAVGSFATFGRAFDLLGDGSIWAVYTPGHTHGHVSFVLRLGEDREALIAGDAAYTRRTIDEGLRPWHLEDEHRFGRSLREIQLYAEHNPAALVVPGHDMTAWRELDAVYA